MSSDLVRLLRVAATVAATYVAFLLCAQFGFLAQLESMLGRDSPALAAVLASMGAAGLGGSALAAGLGRRAAGGSPARRVRAGLVATAAVAAASTLAAGPGGLGVAAAGLGGALGFLTVALAGGLGALAPRGRWGSAAGIGTGAAYALANLPPLFVGSPAVRALAPAALCLVAAVLVPGDEAAPAADDRAEAPMRFAGLVAAFLALVAVDSAAFAAVQRSPVLLGSSWGGAANQLRQGAVHLIAALATGWLLDRGALRSLLGLAGGLFAVAIPALVGTAAAGSSASWAAPAYAVGISIYSAALVAAPALTAGGDPARALARAAVLYGVAGWIGSALGVGAALHGALARMALVGALGVAVWSTCEIAGSARWRRALGPALAIGVAGGAAALLVPPAGSTSAASGADLVARGRQVYLAEGCQHCHSQFVRLASRDELWWGPRRALDRAERPPTPGNRRFGPDLANVGLRRSALWHELHLRDPRRLEPGSRMPAYAHLFDDGSGRGAALVAYLGALGAGAERARAATVEHTVDAAAGSGSSSGGAALFARHCAACHGARGRGDGPLSGRLALPALDLGDGPLQRAAPRPGESPATAIARVIRFGLPPGTMPGHEWLSEREVADLVAYVAGLARGGEGGASGPGGGS